MRHPGFKLVASSLFTVLAGSALAIDPAPNGDQTYSIDWYLIGSGGTSQAAGAGYSLQGSIGQAVAGSIANGTHSLDAGFWHSAEIRCDECIFINGFELEN